MPNWCSNYVSISGTSERVAELAAKIIIPHESDQTDRFEVDFEGIVPMPQELLETEPFSYEVLRFFRLPDDVVLSQCQKEIDVWHHELLQEQLSPYLDWQTATMAEVKVLLQQRPELQELCRVRFSDYEKQERNLKRYGSTDWYTWRLKHWGTKWNGGECYGFSHEAGVLSFDFDTAWSPPEGFYQALCEAYPDLVLEARYMELGMFYAGSYYGKNGMLIDEPCNDEQVKPFCIEHFGMEFDDDEDEDDDEADTAGSSETETSQISDTHA